MTRAMRSAARSLALCAAALCVSLCAAGCAGTPGPRERVEAPAPPPPLRPLASFTETEEEARSLALFVEIGRVLTHPRCVNCHPAGDAPLAGDDSHLHQPPVVRG